MTLNDLGIEVTKIREAINSIEVKGDRNASLIVYSVKTCNNLIDAINAEIKEQLALSAKNQNGSEGGNADG